MGQTRRPIHLRPYVAGDEKAFTLRADMAEDWKNVDWRWFNGGPGPTWTLVRWPAEVIGLGGGVAVPTRPGVFQAWSLLSDIPRGDWPLLLDVARVAIDQLERNFGATRIEAYVRADWPAAKRVLRRLRFHADHGRDPFIGFKGYEVMAKSEDDFVVIPPNPYRELLEGGKG